MWDVTVPTAMTRSTQVAVSPILASPRETSRGAAVLPPSRHPSSPASAASTRITDAADLSPPKSPVLAW